MNRMLLIISSLFLMTGCANNDIPKHVEKSYPVKVAEVIHKDVPIYIETIGHLAERFSVEVRPRVSGMITASFVLGGETVNADDLLYKIDPIPYQVAVNKAEANLVKDKALLEYFKKRLDRYATLVKKEYVAPLTVEEYQRDLGAQEAQVQLDIAELELAKLNLDYTDVKAPVSGHLSINIVDIGNLVALNDHQSDPLARIFQIKPIYVYFIIAQKEFQALQDALSKGVEKKLEVIRPSDTHPPFVGKLDAIDNIVSVETGTIQLRGILPNEDMLLWPGEYVRVRLFLGVKSNAVLASVEAVQIGQKGTYAFVLKDDNTVEIVPVKIGERVENSYIIEEGLQPGMKVITEGQLNLRAGTKVYIPEDKL